MTSGVNGGRTLLSGLGQIRQCSVEGRGGFLSRLAGRCVRAFRVVLLRCHFFQGRSASVGVSMKKSVFGSVSVLVSVFFKASCTANATNTVPPDLRRAG